MRFHIHLLSVAAVSLLLSACSFQLRGQADLPFERIHVETSGFSLFAAELRRTLQSGSKVEVTDTPKQAQIVLRITSEREEKKILSLSGTGSVSEFELIYSIGYRVMDNQLQDLVAPGEISLRRDMTFDDTLTLGKESEEALLYRDMQSDAVQQMLRRLAAIPVKS